MANCQFKNEMLTFLSQLLPWVQCPCFMGPFLGRLEYFYQFIPLVVLWRGHGRWITWCSKVFPGFRRLMWASLTFQKFLYEKSKLKKSTFTRIQTIGSIYSVPGPRGCGKKEKSTTLASSWSPFVDIVYLGYYTLSMAALVFSCLQVLSLSLCAPSPPPTYLFPSFCLHPAVSASHSGTTSSQNHHPALSSPQWI